MTRSLSLGLLAALTLSACAGRAPEPVTRIQTGDDALDCTQLRAGIAENDHAIRGLLDANHKRKTNNRVANAAGAVIFAPATLLMDVRAADRKEAHALQARNRHLMSLYMAQDCTPRLMTEDYDPREARRMPEDIVQ